MAEHDPEVSASLERRLRDSGFATRVADNGEQARKLGLTEAFDLLILDLSLPKQDGFHVLQELRSRGKRLPVIVLADQQQRDVARCLESGADDYMRKPVQLDELVARVRTRLRRATTRKSSVLSAGDVRLDLKTRSATVGDRAVHLTAREFSLLETFIRHADEVLSREQLLSQVWGSYFDPSTNLVSVYVSSLRRKLGDEVIETVRGVGYRLHGR
jgi:DNA-binding response OmpR family regulator